MHEVIPRTSVRGASIWFLISEYGVTVVTNIVFLGPGPNTKTKLRPSKRVVGGGRTRRDGKYGYLSSLLTEFQAVTGFYHN